MTWFVRNPPIDHPVEWEEMKAQVSTLSPEDKPLIMRCVAQATAYAETKLEMSLVERDLTAIFERGDELALPRGPIIPEGITAYSASNPLTSDSDAPAGYGGRLRYIGNKTILVLDNPCAVQWPLAVNYSAGFENVARIPADITGAIRIHAATLYAYREDVVPLSVSPVHRIDDFYRWRSRGSAVS